MEFIIRVVLVTFLIQFLVVFAGTLVVLLMTNPEVARRPSRLARGLALLVSVLIGVAPRFSR